MLTSYLPDESRVSRPLDDGAWKPACESDAASRLQRPTRTPVQPAGMEARQRVERCAARVRAEREDRLETRQTGAQPRDRTPIRRLQVSCTAIVLAGLGRCLGSAPRFALSQSAVLLLNEHRHRTGVAARNGTGVTGIADPRIRLSATATHAPKDLNPDCGGWSSECCRYTRDA